MRELEALNRRIDRVIPWRIPRRDLSHLSDEELNRRIEELDALEPWPEEMKDKLDAAKIRYLEAELIAEYGADYART